MKPKKGFTLIELSLATVFVSVLLISIAFISTQILAIYQKGLAIKAVTSSGRALTDDFTRAIAAGSTESLSRLCYEL